MDHFQIAMVAGSFLPAILIFVFDLFWDFITRLRG